ncbi:MAG TPA: UrcA family protein [Steroidobacteraceae bacterium]|jgi:UrcA family protein|nr:UrcA family protein [Steroidobacteraceae bacterium]
MSTSIRLKQSTAWVALLALASAAAGANPEDTEEVHAENVNYEDLNLTTLAGVTLLYGRIERAARLVCGPNTDQSRMGQWKTCYRLAVAAAVARVNNPLLTAVHDSRTAPPKLATLQSPRMRVAQ